MLDTIFDLLLKQHKTYDANKLQLNWIASDQSPIQTILWELYDQLSEK